MRFNLLIIRGPSADNALLDFLEKAYPEATTKKSAHVYDDESTQLAKEIDWADLLVTDLVFNQSQVPHSKPAQMNFAGLEIIQNAGIRARVAGGESKVVVLSAWDHRDNILECYRHRANAFVSLSDDTYKTQLVDSISLAMEGKNNYPGFSPTTKNLAIAAASPVFKSLSINELEIINLVVIGKTTAQIKKALDSTSLESTVERISKILRSTGIYTRSNCIEQGICIGMDPDI